MALSWVTVAWSAAISASLTLALVNLLVWARDRTSRSHLLFATASVANAVFGAVELGMLRANSPGHLAVLLRWAYLPFFVTFCCLIGFVRLYLDAGRPWLAWAAIGTGDLSSVVLNFLSPGSLRFTAIERAIPVRFLGETVSVPGGVLNPWVKIGQLSGLLFLVFVVDAGVSVWEALTEPGRILGGGGRARRGASGALYPRSASAGLNPRPRPVGSESAPGTER